MSRSSDDSTGEMEVVQAQLARLGLDEAQSDYAVSLLESDDLPVDERLDAVLELLDAESAAVSSGVHWLRVLVWHTS
jgi:hypothetical protein